MITGNKIKIAYDPVNDIHRELKNSNLSDSKRKELRTSTNFCLPYVFDKTRYEFYSSVEISYIDNSSHTFIFSVNPIEYNMLYHVYVDNTTPSMENLNELESFPVESPVHERKLIFPRLQYVIRSIFNREILVEVDGRLLFSLSNITEILLSKIPLIKLGITHRDIESSIGEEFKTAFVEYIHMRYT